MTDTLNAPALPSDDDSLLLCASDLQHSAIYDNHVEMQACIRAVADRISALAALTSAPAATQGETLAYLYQLSRTSQDGSMEDGPWDVVLADEVSEPVPRHYIALAARSTTPSPAAPTPDLTPPGWDKSALPFEAVIQRVQKLGRVDDHHLVIQGCTTVADCGIAGKAYSPQHKAWALAIAALLNKANAAPVSPNTASGV